MQVSQHKTRFYHGDVTSDTVITDISKGYTQFLHEGYDNPFIANALRYDLVLCLSPSHYHRLCLTEIIQFFLEKRNITLSNMGLTAFHEALANTFLWGLLKINRSHDDMGVFHDAMEEAIEKAHENFETLSIALRIRKNKVLIDLINPYDTFDFDHQKTYNSPHLRGLEILQSYSHVRYNATFKTVHLILDATYFHTRRESYDQFCAAT